LPYPLAATKSLVEMKRVSINDVINQCKRIGLQVIHRVAMGASGLLTFCTSFYTIFELIVTFCKIVNVLNDGIDESL
jgi:hypothetical protein